MAELVGVIFQVVHIGGIGVDVPQLVVVLLGLGEGAAQLPEGDVVDLADQRAVPVAHIVHGAIKKVWLGLMMSVQQSILLSRHPKLSL